MNIIHLNTYLKGGAAIAAKQLNKGLQKLPVQSKLIFLHGTSDDPLVVSYKVSGIKKVIKYFYGIYTIIRNRLVKKYTIYAPPFSPFRIHEGEKFKEVDIVHLHWTSYFVDLKSFFKNLDKKVGIVITLHDLQLLYGGIAHDFEINSPVVAYLTSRNKKLIAKYFSSRKVHLVATSKWVLDQVYQHPVLSKCSSSLIHLGIDTTVFKLGPRNILRERYPSLQGKKLLLFVAYNTKDIWKGLEMLYNIVGQLDKEKYTIVTIGKKSNRKVANIDILELGYIAESTILAEIYRSVDLFINPSYKETFGLSSAEALCCGTPVIGFNTGIIPEIIVNGVNGFFVKEFKEADLQEAILHAITIEDWNHINISSHAIDLFNLDKQARNYFQLYNELSSSV